MEQITIQIKNKEKAEQLLEILKALDFVDLVDLKHAKEEIETVDRNSDDDFFSLAGLWKDRDITLTSLRQHAWPRQTS